MHLFLLFVAPWVVASSVTLLKQTFKAGSPVQLEFDSTADALKVKSVTDIRGHELIKDKVFESKQAIMS